MENQKLKKHSQEEKESYYKNRNIALHDYQAIYYPIPKVACTSLIKVCAEVLKIPLKGENLEEELHDMGFPSLNEEEIKNRFPNYFKFAFVRNPWDRMVSLYENKVNKEKYRCRLNSNFRKYSNFKTNMSFNEFIRAIGEIEDKNSNHHFKSQYLSLFEKNPETMDFIGRFENLNQDFQKICKIVDLPKIKLPWLMRENRDKNSYRDYYDLETKKVLEKRFEKDINLFCYGFYR